MRAIASDTVTHTYENKRINRSRGEIAS